MARSRMFATNARGTSGLLIRENCPTGTEIAEERNPSEVPARFAFLPPREHLT